MSEGEASVSELTDDDRRFCAAFDLPLCERPLPGRSVHCRVIVSGVVVNRKLVIRHARGVGSANGKAKGNL